MTVPTELITEARSLKEKIDQEDEGHEGSWKEAYKKLLVFNSLIYLFKGILL